MIKAMPNSNLIYNIFHFIRTQTSTCIPVRVFPPVLASPQQWLLVFPSHAAHNQGHWQVYIIKKLGKKVRD